MLKSAAVRGFKAETVADIVPSVSFCGTSVSYNQCTRREEEEEEEKKKGKTIEPDFTHLSSLVV